MKINVKKYNKLNLSKILMYLSLKKIMTFENKSVRIEICLKIKKKKRRQTIIIKHITCNLEYIYII